MMTKRHPNPLQTPLPMSPAMSIPKKETESESDPTHDRPIPFPKPKLRLQCRQLDHGGSNVFFENTNPATFLSIAVSIVLSTLYARASTNDHIPPTRSVTLILRSMDGVAYTTGLEIDDDHKEIHFSLEYIEGITSRTPGREAAEIQGVLVHEMVHAWQWNALGSAPGGLIEGIADWVRGEAGLAPPHWKEEPADRWDAGYQHTGYFLQWIESEFGKGSVRKINAALQDRKYDDSIWDSLFGKSVQALWETYKSELENGDDRRGDQSGPSENKHRPTSSSAETAELENPTAPGLPS